MTIIDLKITRETERYKFFWVQYSPWYNPGSLKSRFGFVMKSNDDCFWTNTGKRLCASTERAVLARIEGEEDTLSAIGEDEYFKRVWNAQVENK